MVTYGSQLKIKSPYDLELKRISFWFSFQKEHFLILILTGSVYDPCIKKISLWLSFWKDELVILISKGQICLWFSAVSILFVYNDHWGKYYIRYDKDLLIFNNYDP